MEAGSSSLAAMSEDDRLRLRPGDRAQVTVRGGTREARTVVLDRVVGDPQLADRLVPSPAIRQSELGEFGDMTAVQEFIVAAAAGVSTEALIAGVQAALRRRSPEPTAASREHVSRLKVTATPLAAGVLEITVTFEVPEGP